ncbi:MAG TPA: hypothetical protein PKM44_06205 [Turneriella sp.]|nr:hypothetical protein [Turneriella sp.]HMY11096.1 hypothetical protein [Turneriella sp.]HNA80453.1 hypothetical protein [Turneriella sp.]HNE20378.1 hypothetical protein [Turneriella sp.]HNJ66358.1 hypothetical protein [Turneriella sp.]
MSLAEKTAITSAVFLFIVGLVTGIWKYAAIVRSDKAAAPVYVDVLHRATLMYSFACMILYALAGLSVYPDSVNTAAVLSVVVFFVFANGTYLVHALLKDTDNQFEKPYRIGSWQMPKVLFHGSMFALIAGELGGTLVLAVGALTRVWGA